ncbi:putative nuclease HARBI1 [Cyprinus carpio]|uniref:Nuclease HARBI1 n=1 Tax=Cyprinus carpio TaxID=7962 RepID=A0A9Q9YBS8_CYPCA|nr:putative nuclease HARBI1 [Cyprinus carpio]
MKVIMTLRFLATGKMQQCTSDDLGPSQSTVSRVLNTTVAALTTPDIVRQFIDFPTDLQTIWQKQADFMRIAGFPAVVVTIDGTHVRIIAPTVNEETYINRKGFHSINVQVVFDANYKILDLVPKWPGSTYDARVLSQSGLNGLFEQNYVRPGCHLLGDSGYPLKHWLLTPYRRPQGEQPLNYNRAHKVTRAVVERGIGQLKRRFHFLHRDILHSPERACHIIMACGILHNICKVCNLPLLDDDDDDDENDNHGSGASGMPQIEGLRFQVSPLLCRQSQTEVYMEGPHLFDKNSAADHMETS